MINNTCAKISVDCFGELVRLSAIDVTDLHHDCDDVVAIGSAVRDLDRKLRHHRVSYSCRWLADQKRIHGHQFGMLDGAFHYDVPVLPTPRQNSQRLPIACMKRNPN
jgi:hypothetical protein